MGIFLHTDFDAPSIDLKKIKNEVLHGSTGTLFFCLFKGLFFQINRTPARAGVIQEIPYAAGASRQRRIA
jgi:hypothetical protein